MKAVLWILSAFTFAVVGLFIWEKSSGSECFWLTTTLVFFGIFEYCKGFIRGKEDEA